MPGQDLPLPYVGEHIEIYGTWVYDRDHGWREIHPIWAITYLDTGRRVFSLPPVPPRYDPDTGAISGGGGSREPTQSTAVRGPGGIRCLTLPSRPSASAAPAIPDRGIAPLRGRGGYSATGPE